GILLDRIRGHRLLRQSQRGGFVTETHIDEREISNKAIIFRLFFEKRFQFAACLSPSFLSSGMIASDFLGPAQIEPQFAIDVTQGWIRLGQYFRQPREDLCGAALQDRLVNLYFQRLGEIGAWAERSEERRGLRQVALGLCN